MTLMQDSRLHASSCSYLLLEVLYFTTTPIKNGPCPSYLVCPGCVGVEVLDDAHAGLHHVLAPRHRGPIAAIPVVLISFQLFLFESMNTVLSSLNRSRTVALTLSAPAASVLRSLTTLMQDSTTSLHPGMARSVVSTNSYAPDSTISGLQQHNIMMMIRTGGESGDDDDPDPTMSGLPANASPR
jgi:hypothetical protein